MSIEIFALMRFEWALTFLIFILLVMKLSEADQNKASFTRWVNVLLFINLLAGLLPIAEGKVFDGFFQTNPMLVFQKNILNLGLLLISFTANRWLISQKYLAEFFILILSSMLGMFVMLSSGHFLMLYLGLEMSTIPIAALASYHKFERRSSEAGVKLILSSAFSTGILLFGISLLYGSVGNLSFENIAGTFTPNPISITALVFIIGGFAFKMSAVPFHLWTADVYEGSPVVVTNFLSVVSKASVIFVFVSVFYKVFANMEDAWLYIVSILSVLSMTIGNLFAMRQDNIKRLLAFSSISQVGFVLVGIAGFSTISQASVIYFVVIYLLSNITAFGVVGAIASYTGNESLNSSYKGLYHTNPFMALVLAISLFSLAGVPPTAGFFGKLFLLTAGMSNGMYVLLAFAAVNLVLSLYNYLRVVKYMFVDKAETTSEIDKPGILLKSTLIFCTIAVLVIGFIRPLFDYIYQLSL